LKGTSLGEDSKLLMLLKDLDLIKVFLLGASSVLKSGASFATLDLDLIHINSNKRKEKNTCLKNTNDDYKESTLIHTTTNTYSRFTNKNLHVPLGVPKRYIID